MAVMTDETQHPAATVAPVPPGLMLPPSSPEEVAQYAQSARRLSQQQQRETQLQQPLPILRSQASTSTQRQPSYNSSERPPSSAFLAAQAATGALFNQMGRHGVFNPAAYNAMHAFYTPDQAGHSSVEHAQRTLQTQGPVFTSVDGIYPIDTQGYPEQNASTTTGTGSGSGTGASSGSATANNSILQNYPYQQWQYLQPSQMTQPASYPNFQFQQYQYQQGLHDYRNVVEGQTYGVTSTRPRANVVQSSEQLAGGNTASYGRRQSAGQPVSRRGTPSAQDNNTHAHPQMSQMNQMNQMNQMQQMHQMGAQGIAYRPPTAPSSVGDASTPRFPTPSEVTNNVSTYTDCEQPLLPSDPKLTGSPSSFLYSQLSHPLPLPQVALQDVEPLELLEAPLDHPPLEQLHLEPPPLDPRVLSDGLAFDQEDASSLAEAQPFTPQQEPKMEPAFLNFEEILEVEQG